MPRSREKKGEKAPFCRRCLSWKENYWKLICKRLFFLVTEKEEESWGKVIRKGRNEPKGERNLWSSVNEGSRNQRQIKRGKLSTFFCLFIFFKGAVSHGYCCFRDGSLFFWRRTGSWKILHANIFFNVSPSSCKLFIVYLHTIYFRVYSLCKQFIPKFSTPPPPNPRQKKNGPSLKAPLCLSHYLMSRKQQVCSVCLFC